MNYKSFLVNQYPTVSTFDPVTRKLVEKERRNDVPNQIIFNAVLSSGAALSYQLHGETAFSPDRDPRSGKPKVPSLEWRIFGSHGEIRITSYDTRLNTWSLNNGPDLLKVEVYDAREDTLTELEHVEDNFKSLPTPARNMSRLYEAFATARAGRDAWYPDFEYGVKKHELIEAMYKENSM